MTDSSRSFDRCLRWVRLRLAGNLLLGELGWCVCLAGLLGGLAVGLVKFGLLAGAWWKVWPVVPTAVLTGLVLGWLRRPGRLSAALALDRELGTKERFSSAMALQSDPSPFARAAVTDARRAADAIDLKGRFPVRLTARWLVAAGLFAGVALAGLFLPTFDLLGLLERHRRNSQQQTELARARQDVALAASAVRASVRNVDDPDLDRALQALEASGELSRPQDVRRDAIRKLGELKDQLDQRRRDDSLASLEKMQQSLRNLRSLPDPASRELHRAIAEGDFTKAAQTLDELRRKLQDGQLSAEQRDALQRQLADLGEQMNRLAEENRQLERELAQAGLDEEHARLSEDDLREELKKRGWTDEQIDELVRRLDACKGGEKQLAELADQVAGCCEGQLRPADLADLAEAMRRSKDLQDRIARIEREVDQIDNAIRLLGGSADGEGGGLALGRPGGNKAGTGAGAKSPSDPIDAKLLDTRVGGRPTKGSAVASWYFRGRQVRGEAREELKRVVRAARDRAGEAISDQDIPRRYQTPVKRYFGDLDELSRDSTD